MNRKTKSFHGDRVSDRYKIDTNMYFQEKWQHVANISFREALQQDNRITLIIASASVWGILNGQLGQSSSLGFIVGTTGLTLASAVKANQH